MSILQFELPDARVLDLFAGSGALGLEALSRGARHVDFVETAPRSIATLRENVKLLDARADTVVHHRDALRFTEQLSADAYDVAFADPPYREGLAEQIAAVWARVPFARVFGVEHEKGIALPGGDSRVYGDTVVTLFRST